MSHRITIDTQRFLNIIRSGQVPNPDASFESEALRRQAQLYYQGRLQMLSAVEAVNWMHDHKHEMSTTGVTDETK